MITHLKGRLLEKTAPWITLDVNGVGYAIEVSLSTLSAMPALDQEVFIHTQMIVREDAQLLYGFARPEEKKMFQTLIKINGVGAKMALAILSSLSSSEFAHAIHDNNAAILVKIPGVGKKTAERLIVELKDKVSQFDTVNSDRPRGNGGTEQEAVSALEALGYKPADASKRVRAVIDNAERVEDVIRLALKQ